jgi:hypothetical protein
MAERSRKASLHCAVRHNFTSSRGASRSSLNNRYAFSSLHFQDIIRFNVLISYRLLKKSFRLYIKKVDFFYKLR